MDLTVDDASGLAELCGRAAAAGRFALDMEFQRETTYFAKLQLVQLAVDGDVAIVDPLAVTSLDPLYALCADPGVECVVHAGGQDMEIVHAESGLVPSRVFDTQIAAGLAGYGEHPSYRTLVKSALDVSLTKTHSRTDWSRRPLTPEQASYAMDDVRHLLAVRELIVSRLESLGRTDWAEQEMAYYGRKETYSRDPSTLYLRVRRVGSLDRRELSVLRELVAWRELEAARRDRPRGRIVADDVLVDIARHEPSKPEDLSVLRGLHPRELERSGTAICDAVRRALAVPRSAWPHPVRDDHGSDVSNVVDLLDIVMRSCARETGVARAYLGTRQDLVDLVLHLRGRADPPSLLQGWRRSVVGDRLVEVATGAAFLRVDARAGRVAIVKVEPDV